MDLIEEFNVVTSEGPTVECSRRTVFEQVFWLLLNGVYEPPSMSLIMIKDYWRAGLRRAFQTFVHSLNDKIEDQLPKVKKSFEYVLK